MTKKHITLETSRISSTISWNQQPKPLITLFQAAGCCQCLSPRSSACRTSAHSPASASSTRWQTWWDQGWKIQMKIQTLDDFPSSKSTKSSMIFPANYRNIYIQIDFRSWSSHLRPLEGTAFSPIFGQAMEATPAATQKTGGAVCCTCPGPAYSSHPQSRSTATCQEEHTTFRPGWAGSVLMCRWCVAVVFIVVAKHSDPRHQRISSPMQFIL